MAARFNFTETERELVYAGLTLLADQLIEQRGGGDERMALLTQALALREEVKPERESALKFEPEPVEPPLPRRTCACGYAVGDCNPSRCSSPLARDALWGNS
jgi:hypothetical protein